MKKSSPYKDTTRFGLQRLAGLRAGIAQHSFAQLAHLQSNGLVPLKASPRVGHRSPSALGLRLALASGRVGRSS